MEGMFGSSYKALTTTEAKGRVAAPVFGSLLPKCPSQNLLNHLNLVVILREVVLIRGEATADVDEREPREIQS